MCHQPRKSGVDSCYSILLPTFVLNEIFFMLKRTIDKDGISKLESGFFVKNLVNS